MLGQRLITGSVLIGLLVFLAWLDAVAASGCCATVANAECTAGCAPRGAVLALFCALVLAPALAREIAVMMGRVGSAAPEWLCMVAASAGTLSLWWVAGDDPARAAAIAMSVPVALLALTTVFLMGRRTPHGASSTMAAIVLSWAYAGLPWAFWIALERSHGPMVLAGAVLTVKATDIGAYFTGMALGRRKLIPWLSPGKTREGLIGGVLAGTAVGALGAWWSSDCACCTPIEPWRGAVAGTLFGIFGPLGDLAESLLKREARVKDSGTALPGMGGVHDVADSLLLTAPIAWLILS